MRPGVAARWAAPPERPPDRIACRSRHSDSCSRHKWVMRCVLHRICRGSIAMSGHNRWTKIKRKKEAMGATKGVLFTKLIREVTVAARNGGGDPDHNARLRSALLLAREANMPGETIKRAVMKGTG